MSQDPATTVLRLAGAYRLSQAIAAAASLGVGDALGDAARDSGSVSREIGAHPATLHRLLRALAAEGVLHEDASGRFSLTALGQCLRSGDPDGTRAMILGWTCLPEGYEAFGRLAESVLTGRSGFELAFGESFRDYLVSHPDRSGAYGAAMDSTVEAFEDAVDTYDFSTARTVVDVGGGGGAFLTCLMRKHPLMSGVLFEIPSVIERASLADDVAARIECVAGDATVSVPAGGDVYVLCTVLRCFDDQQSVQILSACRRAMHAAATLLACEMVLRAEPLEPYQGLDDLQALTLYGGRDRNPDEWKRLLAEAGLALDRIQPADLGYHWVIATTAEG